MTQQHDRDSAEYLTLLIDDRERALSRESFRAPTDEDALVTVAGLLRSHPEAAGWELWSKGTLLAAGGKRHALMGASRRGAKKYLEPKYR